MRTMLRRRRLLLLVYFSLVSIFSTAQVTQEWAARFHTSVTSTEAEAVDLALDSKGNVYVAGSSAGAGTGLDYTIIKYNAAGMLQWLTRYNGQGNATDRTTAIVINEQDNVYVTGSATGINGSTDMVSIRLNSSTGAIVWTSLYNGPANSNDAGNAIFADEDGNSYVTGTSIGNTTGEDYVTIKYGPTGASKWIKYYNGPANSSDRAVALALDNKGNILVTGVSMGIGSNSDYATIKYNSSGSQQWVRRYNGAGNDRDVAESVAVDKSGNVYVTGTVISGFDPSGDPFPFELFDWATVKYNASGVQQWAKIYDNGGDDFATSVKVDRDGNPYVTGSISNSPPRVEEPDLDYGTIKYNPAGVQQWVAKYGPPPGVDFNEWRAMDQALDKEGNVYVTGQTGQQEYGTVKFSRNGVFQWAQTYAVGLNQVARAVVVDDLGNVYVTGRSDTTNCIGCYSLATIKYSQFACGKNGDKYLICHNGKTLCLKKSEAEEHLCHGDKPGECSKDDLPARLDLLTGNDNGTTIPGTFKVTVAPNPVISTAKIYYELPIDGRVSIKVFDMLGRQVATLVDAAKPAGLYNTDFNVATMPSGMYTYQVMVKTAKKSWSQTGKISVIR